MQPGIREAALWKQTLHDGISYDATKNPQNGGVCYSRAPGGAFKYGHLTDIFTFTGDNKSYYMGSAGLLVPSVTNTPRIEYDSIGNLKGLLIEGNRINFALFSNDGRQVSWIAINVTQSLTSIGPEGGTDTATIHQATAANGTLLQTVVSASATRTYSVWLKRRTGTGNIDLTLDGGVGWTTKAITTSWARYEITQAAVTNPIFGIRIVTSGDAIDVWGNQLESAAFASSAIPTTTGSVARAQDVCNRTFGAEYIVTAGTCFAEFDMLKIAAAATSDVFSLESAGRHLYVANGGSNTSCFDGTSVVACPTSITQNVMYKAASSFDASGQSAGSGGAPVSSGAFDGAWGTGATAVSVGDTAVGASNALFGHIRRLDYWPERKSNAFLQRITGA